MSPRLDVCLSTIILCMLHHINNSKGSSLLNQYLNNLLFFLMYMETTRNGLNSGKCIAGTTNGTFFFSQFNTLVCECVAVPEKKINVMNKPTFSWYKSCLRMHIQFSFVDIVLILLLFRKSVYRCYYGINFEIYLLMS